MSRTAVGVSVLALALAIVLWLTSGARPPSVRRVNSADPKLQAAVRQAQRQLGDFDRALASPADGRRFAVKGKFETPSGPEYLWVRDPLPRDGQYRGTLDQEPIAVANLHKGDTVSLPRSAVVDWLIREPGGVTRGAFTERALTGG